MSTLNFEIFVNDEFVFTATNADELLLCDNLVERYLDDHPNIDRLAAKVKINIKRESCRGCK